MVELYKGGAHYESRVTQGKDGKPVVETTKSAVQSRNESGGADWLRTLQNLMLQRVAALTKRKNGDKK